jgi:hypothetical protein
MGSALNMTNDTDAEVYATISRTIEQLRALRGIPAATMRRELGMNRSTWYSRLAGSTRWTVAEVKHAADLVGVDVGVLFSGLDVDAVLIAAGGHSPVTGTGPRVTRGYPPSGWPVTPLFSLVTGEDVTNPTPFRVA